jgi:imidazolonepropionase-like amidohydrolase
MTKRTLIKGAFLWDGFSEKLLPEMAIVVEDKKIESIIPIAETESSSFDEVHDFFNLTLLPGMIDCHTHHSMDATMVNYLDRIKDSISELAIRSIAMMKKDLISGVTTCRTLGDREFLDIAFREAVKDGLIEGPRSIVAGKGIRAAKGHGFVGYPFDGAEEICRAIKENLAVGADFIKIYITGTLKGNGNLPSYLTREEIESAIMASHEAGVSIASHCVGGIGLEWALDMGLDTLEHGYHISDSQIEKLVKSDTRLVLTLSPILNDEVVNHYPKHLVQGYFDEREEISSRMTAIISAKIPFGLGTDGMHGGLANEAKYAVGLGASNYTALQAATINGARICGIEDETGSLSPGKYADIIAVEGNPLENIQVLKKVKTVVKQGQLMTASCFKHGL